MAPLGAGTAFLQLASEAGSDEGMATLELTGPPVPGSGESVQLGSTHVAVGEVEFFQDEEASCG